MTEIIDLLEIYQKKGWVKILPFAYMDFNKGMVEGIGYHPMHELNARNQALAYTDCLMKYRESSEFVIVADIDDILIPQKKTYYKEFLHWSKVFQNSVAFMYYRVDGKTLTASNNHSFSLYNMVNSLRVDNTTYVGKSVYQTKYAEMAWIHWPGFDNTTTATIPPSQGLIYHTSIENLKEYKRVANIFKTVSMLSKKAVKAIAGNFSSMLKKLPSFQSKDVYAKIIQKCWSGDLNYQNPLSRPDQKQICITPFQCRIPKIIKNFKCTVAKRNHKTNYLKNYTVLHIPDNNFYWSKFNNGCIAFDN